MWRWTNCSVFGPQTATGQMEAWRVQAAPLAGNGQAGSRTQVSGPALAAGSGGDRGLLWRKP